MEPQHDCLGSSNLQDHTLPFNPTQPDGESLHHRRANPGYDSDDDGSASMSSSVYSQYSSSGCSYSEDSTEHLERSPDGADCGSLKKGPYMYHGRTFVVAIPGLLLVLAVGGETLLTVITCSGLIVHLCVRSGNKSRSLTAYIIAFICVQLILMYSVLPLLWKSLYTYGVIVPTITTYGVMTGAWLLLTFDSFNQDESELAQFVELLLFTLYPMLCVTTLTWLSSAFIASVYVPYVFLLTGFAILQYYLLPVPSSYYNPVGDSKDDGNVLHPTFPACFALLLCWMPLSVFLVRTAATDASQLFQVVTAVECFFITTLSTFLATFLNLHQFLDDAGFSYDGVWIARQSCGNASVLGFCLLLYCRHVLSHLLPWLPIAVILHIAFGALWSFKKKKVYMKVVSALLCIYYILLFCQLPWYLDYYVAHGSVSIGAVFALLLCNCMMTVTAMYTSLYWGTDTFGSVLLLQTLGFVLLEVLLLRSKLYSLFLLASVSTCLVYVILRLYHSKKLLWQPALASVSLHLTVLWTGIDITYPSMQCELPSSHMTDLFDFLTAWLLLAVLCKTYLFMSSGQLDTKRMWTYVMISVVASLLAAHAFVPKLAWLAVGRKQPLVADVLAFSAAIVGLSSLKLEVSHRNRSKPNRRLGTISVTLAILLIVMQPACQLTRFEVLKWLLMGSTMFSILVVTRTVTLNSMTRLNVSSFVIGCPAGLALVALVYGDGVSVVVYLLFGLLTSVCVQLALATWLPARNLETIITSRVGVLLVTSLTLSLMDWFSKPTAQDASHYRPPAMLPLAGSCLVAAAILKTASFLHESEFLTSHGGIRQSKLPILGNMLTLIAFISVCTLQPLPHWQHWVLGCSGITLLFQRDSVLLTNLRRVNQMTLPVAIASFTVMASAVNGCRVWSTSTLSVVFILDLSELLLILLEAPILVVFISILWHGKYCMGERFVVFLMPLGSILFLIATTYVAWLFGFYTIVVGVWLMIHKLPLTTFQEKQF